MRIGAGSITAAYLGSTAISKVYLGAAQVFDSWSSVGLMTDIDSDIDDVVAEALLFDLLREQGKPLSYFSVASRSNTAAHCQRVLLDQAGYSGVPLGQMQTPTSANSSSSYNNAVAALKTPVLNRTDYPDSVVVMRTALAAMPDQSHKIITIGNLTDYAALLQSPADAISPLTGIQLVAAKVISVHAMGGYYPNTTTTEANVNGDTPSANYVAENTPVPIYWGPYALGNDVMTRIPTAGFRSDADAYVVAWNAYGVASRQSWDAIPVLHAMLGLNGWFIDRGLHDVSFTGGSTWTPNPNGKNIPLGRSTTSTVLRDYINGRVDAFMDVYGLKTTPTAPVFTADPVVSGTAAVGSQLSVTNGTVTGFPAPTFARQWFVEFASNPGTLVPISGAEGATYTVSGVVPGDKVIGAVTATNSEGSATAFSAPVTVVETPEAPDPGSFTPASLFGATEQGYWIDPSDFSTMTQDIAGTVPVTEAGQPVGRILDKSGKGNHFAAPANANRPTLQVDGTGRYYLVGGRLNSINTFAPGADKVQVVSGIRKSALTNATEFLCEFSTSVDTQAGSFFVSAPHNTAAYGFRVRGSSLAPTLQSATFAGEENAVLSNMADLTEPSRSIRRNGSSIATATTGAGTGNFGTHRMFLMARSGGTVAFTGRLYQQVCRFGAPLNATQITDLESFVNTKTGAF